MTIASIDTIQPRDLAGQAVLIRVDAEDDLKLRDALPTLSFASQARARLVVATRIGAAHDAAPRTDAIAARLSEWLGHPVGKLDDWKGEAGLRAVSHLTEGEILMLENLAFEDGESAGADKMADELGRLCDIFCNEAFALAHEVRASTVGVAKRAKRALAGLTFERELTMLQTTLREPRGPCLAVLGGALSKDKLLLAEEIAGRTERTLVAGQLVFPFLITKGSIRSNAAVTEEMVGIAERMIAAARQHKRMLHTPADFTVVERSAFERLSRGEFFVPPPVENVAEDRLETDHVVCDIGKATRWSWSDSLGSTRTIFWHGPLGITEIDLFCEGSRFLANEMAIRTWPALHRSVVCGTSLVNALRRLGVSTERIRHLTHAGLTALHYFAGRPLPAVEVLSQVQESKPRPFRILIPLDGSERDLASLHAAAELAARNAEIVLLHVRSGPDEEEYPGVIDIMSQSEKLERRIESERVFAQANAILACRGLLSTHQLAVQGSPRKIILRFARRMKIALIVWVAAGGFTDLRRRHVLDRTPSAALVVRPR
jgi:phosphoglycerate kinase